MRRTTIAWAQKFVGMRPPALKTELRVGDLGDWSPLAGNSERTQNPRHKQAGPKEKPWSMASASGSARGRTTFLPWPPTVGPRPGDPGRKPEDGGDFGGPAFWAGAGTQEEGKRRGTPGTFMSSNEESTEREGID